MRLLLIGHTWVCSQHTHTYKHGCRCVLVVILVFVPYFKLYRFITFFFHSCLNFPFLSLDGSLGSGKESGVLHFGKPDDVDISVELKNWLFALEGEQEMAEKWWFYNHEDVGREERCWHTSFQNLQVKAKGIPKHLMNGKSHKTQKYPVELVTVRIYL